MRPSLIGLFPVEIVLCCVEICLVFSFLYHRVCGSTVTRYELMTLFCYSNSIFSLIVPACLMYPVHRLVSDLRGWRTSRGYRWLVWLGCEYS